MADGETLKPYRQAAKGAKEGNSLTANPLSRKGKTRFQVSPSISFASLASFAVGLFFLGGLASFAVRL